MIIQKLLKYILEILFFKVANHNSFLWYNKIKKKSGQFFYTENFILKIRFNIRDFQKFNFLCFPRFQFSSLFPFALEFFMKHQGKQFALRSHSDDILYVLFSIFSEFSGVFEKFSFSKI